MAKAMTKEDMIAAIKNMTVLDLAELVKALEEEFGVSAAPLAMAAAQAAGPAAAPAAEAEEQTEFSVILAIFESVVNRAPVYFPTDPPDGLLGALRTALS